MTDCDGRHIVLVGMMGAGKSSTGRALASRLDRPFFDTDEMVEESTGRSVREIWDADGEPTFRSLETEAVRSALTSHEPAVVAAAGGVVLRAENRDLLVSDDVCVVWLLAGVDALVERVINGMHRPLLDADPRGTLSTMFDQREDLYREVADAIVSVDHRSPNDVLQAVQRCTS